MVSSALHPDHVAAEESEADATKGIEASALTSPTSTGRSRYRDLLLINAMLNEGMDISEFVE